MPSIETLPKEHILKLKPILEREQGRAFTDEEVERIARDLVNLFTHLADNQLGIGHIADEGTIPPQSN
jgi:hypothetical protein